MTNQKVNEHVQMTYSVKKALQQVLQYLQDKKLPKLNDNQWVLYKKDKTEKEVKHELN